MKEPAIARCPALFVCYARVLRAGQGCGDQGPVVTSGIDVDAQEGSPMGLETNLHRRANGVYYVHTKVPNVTTQRFLLSSSR
ncbi:MAG: hypothetical protein DDT26_02124 [Dehalococcoidia bacterium]|nr:hypothetical protein [Chloroflexota bacterium]MBT9166271.1 hypothetical protein [Chloroflexota bacterium]